MENKEQFKSGFVAVLGKPNAGKSTLVNRLVGEKVSIVTHKPQTTRDKIVGIVNGARYQMVLVDTPGLHRPKNKLSEYMMKSADSAREGADIFVYVIACDKRIDEHDEECVRRYAAADAPFVLVLNKCDEAQREEIARRIEYFAAAEGIDAIVPVSALTGRACDELEKVLVDLLPEGAPYYEEDQYTDKSERYMIAEIIREKALKLLSAEIPYGVGVDVEKYERRADGLLEIGAVIICEKQSHKGIVIGKGGEMLKRISTYARQDVEQLTGGKVYLRVFVKVKDDWRDNAANLNKLGYGKDRL